MCPLLAQLIIGFFSFFLLLLFTVLMKQTRQVVRAVKQSMFIDVYGLSSMLKTGNPYIRGSTVDLLALIR